MKHATVIAALRGEPIDLQTDRSQDCVLGNRRETEHWIMRRPMASAQARDLLVARAAIELAHQDDEGFDPASAHQRSAAKPQPGLRRERPRVGVRALRFEHRLQAWRQRTKQV